MHKLGLTIAAGLFALPSFVWAQDAAQTVSSSVLLEEAVLADPGLNIPDDGYVRIQSPEGTPDKALALDGFIFDSRAGIFAARLVLADGSRIGLRGQATVTVPALVPVRRLSPGEIITEADLALSDVPLASLPENALRSSSDLIGKEVQRTLSAGRPVLATAVREPRAIKRGDQVVIGYAHAGIALTAKGKALQDGILGQEIRVVNLSSNRTITAVAAAPGEVIAN